MLNRTLAIILFLLWHSSYVLADQVVELAEANLAFSLPDSWDKTMQQRDIPPDPPSHLVQWNGPLLTDESGKKVTPGLNIITNPKWKPEMNGFAGFSSIVMEKQGFHITDIMKEARVFSLPNSISYLADFRFGDNRMRSFVIHTVNHKGEFVQVQLLATYETFQLIGKDFLKIIRSLKHIRGTE